MQQIQIENETPAVTEHVSMEVFLALMSDTEQRLTLAEVRLAEQEKRVAVLAEEVAQLRSA